MIKATDWIIWDDESSYIKPSNVIKGKYNYVYDGFDGSLYIIDIHNQRFYDFTGFISFYDYIEREYDIVLGSVVISYSNVRSIVTDFNRGSDGQYEALLSDVLWVPIGELTPLKKHRNDIINGILEL